MNAILTELISQIPFQAQLRELLPYLSLFILGLLILGVLGRVFLGKRSSLNHSVSSAMAILFIYITTIAIYTFRPWNLEDFLSPLPCVTLTEDMLVFQPFQGTPIPLLCARILPLLILAFLVNLLDTFIPQGGNVLDWFLYRFVTVVLSMGLYLVANWAFNTFLPDVLVDYAPMILLGVLIAMLLVGVLNVLLGLVLTAINPIFGGIYAFFFSNAIGKQLTKAVFTTVLLCALFLLIEHFGFFAISISETSLIGYLPAVGMVLVLWYLLGHTL